MFYIHQHFQDSEKIHQIDTDSDVLTTQEDSLYPYVNNDIDYGLFEDIVESYHLDSQIKDDFQCDTDCYTQTSQPTKDDYLNICTHDYQHIAQNIDDLSDPTQQNKLYLSEESALSFTDNTDMHCDYSISVHTSDIPNTNDTHTSFVPIHPAAHSQRKHAYRDTSGDTHIQYHEFDNKDLLTVRDKYTALLQQELQNPYWNLHDPIMTKSYQISKDMDIETMPHTMYFTVSSDTVTKINQVPYQTIQYNENGMFTAKLMNDTPIEIFIDNGATPSILPLRTYNKFSILHTYPKTESNTPIHTGGGMITSHFWLEIPLKLQHQTIQIKALVCDSECPYDLILGRTSMAQLSAWQDYATDKLYIQQISIPLTLRNNVQILPGKTGIVTLTLQPNKTSFTPRHTIIGKGIAYVKPLDQTLPLRPIEIELENNRCCMEVHNTSDSTVEFLYGQEMAYFDARSKGLVQINNSKHFPIDQYLHDRMTPATLNPSPLAYEKPIHPAKMPHITTRTELPIDDTNKSTPDNKYPWLDPDDPRRNMTDKEILRMKLNLKDSVLKEKEEFLTKVEQFTDVFSLRDEIGTCPFIEVHLKLKDETPFFVRPYPMREEQKKVIQKEMDRLEHLGIILKGLTGYSSLVVLVKRKNQNLYRVCSDFRILNEKLVKINHAFPLVRDCIEQLGRKKCHYLSTIDLRDTFHTLRLALSSQKYCGITPYYGSPTYHYLHMGMGMSVSPQIWQQFVDLAFQDNLIKHKQNFDIIMDNTFIHSTAEEHMDDLIDLFKVLRKYGLKLSPHKCQFFKKKIVYMGLEFQIQEDKVCYTPLKDKCDAI